MKKLLFVIATLLLCPTAFAEAIQCIEVEVVKGDTFNCITLEKEQIKIRLYQVEAPELEQPYGREAQSTLIKLLSGQPEMPQINPPYVLNHQGAKSPSNKFITVYVKKRDKLFHYGEVEVFSYFHPCIYKSRAGMEKHCFASTVNVNRTMIQKGMALSTGSILSKNRKIQKEASEAKRGLWTDPNPISP